MSWVMINEINSLSQSSHAHISFIVRVSFSEIQKNNLLFTLLFIFFCQENGEK